MFVEDDLEHMVIDAVKCNGWKYIPSEALPRAESDVLVESMVRDALIRLNPVIAKTPSLADSVIYKLRSLILTTSNTNLITQNELFKSFVFEKNSFPFGKDGRSVPIRFFATEPQEICKNEFVITNQWVYPQAQGGKRFDIVLLVNGFPLVIGELKTPVRDAISWVDGAKDILAYEQSVPGMFVTNVLTFASEGKCLRYSSIGAPIPVWGPWHVGTNKAEGTLKDVRYSLVSFLKPEIILDIFRYFTIFATDKQHRKFKIISRYQQYEGANLIVERVRNGYPKKGLIWHFQGSGKSLLMVFAAQKLRMQQELNNPTVVIVDDRKDLETQISATFNASDIPNLERAESREALVRFFRNDNRKILITTIFKFAEINEVLNTRSNIILLVDEAHRTQEGDLGNQMRIALPNAFFFGLTGTPINRLDKNTFKTFGADQDKRGYMSLYTFADSIRDKATLPLVFEPVEASLKIDTNAIDEAFAKIADEANLTEEQKIAVSKRIRMEALIKAPERMRKVCEFIVKHYREHIEPNGYKGQVVCYDRETCLLYKEIIDELMGAEASTVVIDTNNDKSDRYKAYRRSRDEEAAVLNRFRDPNDPLKLIIVTSKLLTGFDAPILQVMYLDKPMKDHTLLQAICRTNRVYNDGKTYGLIVDFIGIFDDVAKALKFDEKSMTSVIKNIEEVKKKIPELLQKCLRFFPGVDRNKTGWDALIEAQNCLPDNKTKDEFAANFRVLNRVWNALSPDPVLWSIKHDYVWLSKVYESVKPLDGSGGLIWAAVGPKTVQLIHENVEVLPIEIKEEIALDPAMIERFIKGETVGKNAVKEIELNLVAKLIAHTLDPRFVALGEKLEKLRQQHEAGLITSLEFLKHLLECAKDAVRLEKTTPDEPPIIDKGKAALTELFDSVKNNKTPVIVQRIVDDIDSIVKKVRFNGWQNTTTGRSAVSRELRKVIMVKYGIKDATVFDKAYSYVQQYY